MACTALVPARTLRIDPSPAVAAVQDHPGYTLIRASGLKIRVQDQDTEKKDEEDEEDFAEEYDDSEDKYDPHDSDPDEDDDWDDDDDV